MLRQHPEARIVVGIIAAIVLTVGFFWWQEGDQRRGDDVGDRVEAATGKMPVSDVADFDFDRFVIVSGGADEGEIERAIGTSWGAADDEAYHCCMPGPIWVFVEDEDVVAWLRPDDERLDGWCLELGTYTPDEVLDFGSCVTSEGPRA